MKANNKGFSLIEMVVVLAIMAIIIGLSGLSLSYISNAKSKSCIQNINNAMEECRNTTMAKNYADCSMDLYLDSDGNVVVRKNWTGETEVVGGNRLTITYKVGNATSTLDDTGINISFSKSTGAFAGSTFIKEITVSGMGKSYTITCYELTGKTKVE